MFKIWMLAFILIHILGDYYFQFHKLSEDKEDKYIGVLKHSGIYAGCALIVLIPIYSFETLIAVVFISISHFIIDTLKFIWIKVINGKNGNYYSDNKIVWIYIIDQIAHIICMIIIAYVLVINNQHIKPIPIISQVFLTMGIDLKAVLKWMTLVLLVGKPTNISIKKVLSNYTPEKKDIENKTSKQAGALIGTIERFVILILLGIQQYSAIGLVLTAKSIARYSKINEDQEFAEYYLIGTLLSTLIAICVYVVVI